MKALAFYLPAYHQIPENDKFWGEGFTEWDNVRGATPKFEGHEQPNIPWDYYNLTDYGTIKAQAMHAKAYGLGWCIYTYWFNGHQVFRKPLDIILEHPEIDVEICLCWANEPWTRRWDGKENDVLLAQNHSLEDSHDYFLSILPALKDPRYVTLGGKKPLLVYRTELFDNFAQHAQLWREMAQHNGFELLIIRGETFTKENPAASGCDAAYEFPPLQTASKHHPTIKAQGCTVYDFDSIIESAAAKKPKWPLYRCVMPNWDNAPRRKEGAHIFHGATVRKYGEWLRAMCNYTVAHFPPEQCMVLINAWNEWGESAFLEPCERHRMDKLEKTKEVLNAFK